MQPRKIQLGLAVLAGIFVSTIALRSQQTPPVGPVWEYTTLTGPWNYRATTCYASPSGCKNVQEDSRNEYESLMIGAAKLGEKGWELAAVTEGGNSRVMYFKRLRSAIHRND